MFEVASVVPYRDSWIFRFAGVERIEDAARLAGCEVIVPDAERTELAEGEFFLADLLDCEVIEAGTGKMLGRVKAWQEYGGPPLLEVAAPAGDKEPMLVPFARSIVKEIDLGARRIVVDVPAGLKELNAE
jgi:16S rRNA processing protein RimM